MSIDFATLQGLTIPEGVVTQITDASGNILWSAGGKDVILEVEKITSNTYASETTYENESFILLDIYPKTNGTVSVTYGDLTKTITDTSGAESPNAQQVFFGTFNGVSDSVTTPDSGTLTISGGCRSFAVGLYYTEKNSSVRCVCVTAVTNFGSVTSIENSAFNSCSNLTKITIPDSMTSIGASAFSGCTRLTEVTIGDGVTSIGYSAFFNCRSLTEITIPDSVTSIGSEAFQNCINLTEITIGDSVTSIYSYTFYLCTNLTKITIGDSVTSIGEWAFQDCSSLAEITIPDSITSIGKGVFNNCSALTGVTFENTSGWYITETEGGDISTGTAIDVTDSTLNAQYLTSGYKDYYWYRT